MIGPGIAREWQRSPGLEGLHFAQRIFRSLSQLVPETPSFCGATPVIEVDGEFLGILDMVVDVEETKQTEARVVVVRDGMP